MNLVDNSVQTQFANLNKERDILRNTASAADRDRRREEQLLENLRSSQIQLEENLRVAHTELGSETRKKKILEDERKRLKEGFESDRQSIVKIASELKGIEADEKRQKLNFVKEMENLNNELDFLLCQCENQKTLGLLDVETVYWLVETKLNQKLESIRSTVDGPDEYGRMEDGNSMEIEKWNDVASKIKEELLALVEAQEKLDSEMKEKEELENLVRGLREKFLAEHGNIGEMEMNDLEAKWEQQWDYDDGANDDVMEDGGNGSNMEVGEVGSSVVHHHHPSHPFNAAGATASPVHMELFYDANEYSNPSHDVDSSNMSQYATC